MRYLLFTLMVASTAFAADYPLPAGAEAAAAQINRPSLEGPIRFLSSDLLAGRGPASEGDRLAQLYLATEMQSIGLEPGGPNGSWYQPFDIIGIEPTVPKTWAFTPKSGQPLSFDYWTDFIASSGVQNQTSVIDNAEVVFVGYGIQAPEYKWDDFKGQNLKGKVLLMLNNDPDWDPKLFEGNKRLYYGRWTYKYESAARQGAAGAIIIHTTPSAGYPWQVVQTSWSGEQFELPAEGEPRIQVAGWLTEDAAKRLVSAAGRDLAKLIESAKSPKFKPVPLGVTTSLQLQNEISRKSTGNVLGLLRGSERPDEVVVYTAHHDHLGVGEPNTAGDRIYNGALDNASGSAQLLAIARAFAALPQRPSRSILFNFVAAEEQGLLGSEYYATHPTFHPGKMAANLNFDGANIWGRTTDISQVGFGKSQLDDLVRHFAAQQGRTIKPESFPDRGFYYRSDQFNFAKIGVPAIYLDTGTEFRDRPQGWGKEQIEAWEAKHYHQPSDELDGTWNFDGIIEDARLGFFAGLAIAQMPDMPAWNPGDEFEAARKKALAEARD
jgi:Zn-dependent M28 family amino/carboxypeptidase